MSKLNLSLDASQVPAAEQKQQRVKVAVRLNQVDEVFLPAGPGDPFDEPAGKAVRHGILTV